MSKVTFWVVAMVGGRKVRVRECASREDAERAAEVLSEGAESNPRNPAPRHWVEEVVVG